MGSGGSGGQIISKPGQTEDCQGQQLQFLSVYGAERAPGRALRRGRECFLKLKGLNPRDPNVSDGLARCKAGKAALAKEKEAGQYWNSIKDSWERGKYERYLAQYTDNKNAGARVICWKRLTTRKRTPKPVP